MGSIAGIVLRKADGSIHKTSGSAQDISWFVNNVRLVNKDPQHIERFLDENDFSGEEHQDLRPVGNGLVVVDMARDQILRYQDVTSIGYFNGINVTEAARALIEENSGDPNLNRNIIAAYKATGAGADEYACVRFFEFLKMGKITSAKGEIIREYQNGSDSMSLPPRMPVEEIDSLLKRGGIRCELDMSPFTVSTYAARTAQGAKDLQTKMRELGFDITSENPTVWKDWVKMYAKK